MDIVTLAAARKGGGSGGDVTKQYVDEHLALKADKTETKEYPIADSVSGDAVSVTNSADGYVQDVTIYGRSRDSKNICTGFEQGAITASGNVEANDQIRTPQGKMMPVVPSTTYTFSCTASKPTQYAAIYYDTNRAFISGGSWTNSGSGNTTPSTCKYVRLIVRYTDTSNITPSDISNYQLELGSTHTPYEPYGIISIGDSGSLTITTANSDSSESSTATLTTGLPLCEIPVNSGETYTDGDGVKWLADTTSVEGVEKRCGVVDLGDLTWTYTLGTLPRFSTVYPDIDFASTARSTPLVCAEYEVISDGRPGTELPDMCIYCGASDNKELWVVDNRYNDASAFKTAVTGVKLIYPLATPTTQELTSTEKSALLALRTFDSTTNVTITDNPFVDISYIKNTANGKAAEQLANNLRASIGWISAIPEMHRNILRGKYLGSAVSAAQLAAIADGSFDDLYVGDYWTIPVTIDGTTVDVNWRIADIDYYLHTGDTPLTAHHLVIVPDTGLYAARMNTTNINTGGYKASEMYTTNLGTAKTAINTAFPDMVLTHRDLMLGNPADTPTWADSTVELLSEIMTHGTQIMSPCNGSGQYNIFWMIAKSQLALFRLAPWFGVADDTYWLRDVVGGPSFAAVSAEGTAEGWGASNELGVRPYFLLGSAE